MNDKATHAVLEEVLRRAMDEALDLHAKDWPSEEERGQLMAYFNILDWGKQQAEIMGIEFGDKELRAFDPYSLISRKAA